MTEENNVEYQPVVPLQVVDVNIINVLNTDSAELAKWVAIRLLNIRLPTPGPNHTVDLGSMMNIMSLIANRVSFATELYGICSGAKPGWTIAKKDPAKREEAEGALALINAHMDILYRAIQALESQREAAGRIMTGSNNLGRMAHVA